MTTVPLFVNGGGMRGGNVHHSIEGLPFLGEANTAPRYRFFSVRDEFPGLWPVDEGGVSVPELLRAEAVRLAARPSVEEWLRRTRRRSSPVGRVEVLAALDEQRGAWPDAGR